MVTFLDTGLLGIFSLIFIFLLVYAAVWAVLVSRKPLGDNNGLYSIISISIAFLAIMSRPVIVLLETLIPWYTLLAIVFMMIIIAVSVFSEVKWIDVIKDPVAKTWIIILIGAVFVLGVAFTFGQAALEAGTGQQAPAQPIPAINPETGEVRDITTQPRPGVASNQGPGDFQSNFITTLVHPRVLGLLLIFLISLMIVFFLSRPAGGL